MKLIRRFCIPENNVTWSGATMQQTWPKHMYTRRSAFGRTCVWSRNALRKIATNKQKKTNPTQPAWRHVGGNVFFDRRWWNIIFVNLGIFGIWFWVLGNSSVSPGGSNKNLQQWTRLGKRCSTAALVLKIVFWRQRGGDLRFRVGGWKIGVNDLFVIVDRSLTQIDF